MTVCRSTVAMLLFVVLSVLCLIPHSCYGQAATEDENVIKAAKKMMISFKIMAHLASRNKWEPLPKATVREKGVLKGNIEQLDDKKGGKIFRARYRINAPLETLIRVLVDDYDKRTEWAPGLAESKLLKRLDADTTISYFKTTPQAGGKVSARDNIHLNRIEQDSDKGEVHLAFKSFDYPGFTPPPGHDATRMKTFLSGFRLRSSKSQGPTDIEYFAHDDYKLDLLPPDILNRILPSQIMAFMKALAQRAEATAAAPGA